VSLPRVTEILEAVGLGPDFSMVPPHILEAARLRGSAFHEAHEASVYHYLDDTEVSPEVAAYLDGYHKFCTESGYKSIAAEFEVVHPTWQYRGHPDDLGWLSSRRTILELKTGQLDLESASYQVTAYRLAWNASHPTEPVGTIGVLHLPGDGTGRFHAVNPAEYEQTFLSAFIVYHAQRRKAA
jgi:hypothetical protein